MADAATAELWCWRHPRAIGAAGRCIGQTDLPVDRRKAKRLAHRIRQTARVHGLPRVVWVSTLQRAGDVGAWLARWGWRVHRDARLCELNFGRWDGLPWTQIAWTEVEAWRADLLHHAPGGGESLAQMALRVRHFVDDESGPRPAPRLLVTHGGWINALLHARHTTEMAAGLTNWPAPPPHGSLTHWSDQAG